MAQSGFTVLLIHHGPNDPGSSILAHFILMAYNQEWNSLKAAWIMVHLRNK